ncbi:hypothetical protein [Streptomyces sp. NPDC048710]
MEPQPDEGHTDLAQSLQRFDDVCGGTWWREYFADAVASDDKDGLA